MCQTSFKRSVQVFVRPAFFWGLLQTGDRNDSTGGFLLLVKNVTLTMRWNGA
jgi:hypothetical protein